MIIPNFAAVEVDAKIFRGAQPVASEDWQFLKDLGVEQVIKLNEDSEGSDDGALDLGMILYKCPISALSQAVPGIVTPDWFQDAVGFISPGTFIHCEHGQDRTGLVVALYRFWEQKWPKSLAEAEMIRHGFHKLLFGLWEAWERAK